MHGILLTLRPKPFEKCDHYVPKGKGQVDLSQEPRKKHVERESTHMYIQT